MEFLSPKQLSKKIPLLSFPILTRVFTVFSTSKDHGQGARAIAGCILVDSDKIQVINRSPAYKNKYVHHRSSIGNDLTENQVNIMNSSTNLFYSSKN